ncbi:MAG TPA: methyltransferase domain-containing protein [Gemmata sp.]|nr:methyltransferase domain-containing protein [Gemmata sp.]
MATSSLPAYDAHQSAFHEAFRDDLYRLIDALPLRTDAHVLDVPCGNGFYSRRLAGRLGERGQLHAVDANEAYLDAARASLDSTGSPATVEVRAADVYRLPYPDHAFDFVWCAQSLISLDPEPALREMFRVAKPDGLVAILEVDEFHHILLSWPADLEAALPQAVHAASVQRYGSGVKLSPSRRLRRILKQVGFQSVRRETYPIERAAPFDEPTAVFLTEHFAYLKSFARPFLQEDLKPDFDRLTDPAAGDSLLHHPDSELVCINAVYLARPRRLPRGRLAR